MQRMWGYRVPLAAHGRAFDLVDRRLRMAAASPALLLISDKDGDLFVSATTALLEFRPGPTDGQKFKENVDKAVDVVIATEHTLGTALKETIRQAGKWTQCNVVATFVKEGE